MKNLIAAALLAAVLMTYTGCAGNRGSTSDSNTPGSDSASVDTETPTYAASDDITSGTSAKTDSLETTSPETDSPETNPPVTESAATDSLSPEPNDTEQNYVRPESYPSGLYSVEQLEAFDNTLSGWGPGINGDELNRPYGATNAQNSYGKYNAVYIMPESDAARLTFDLGYEYNDLTGKILDILKEKGVKGTFFVTMDYVSRNPGYVRRIIDEGHTLGNHSVNHKSMPTLSIAEMESEIMGLHNYVKENFGYTMNLFRPPAGEFSERTLAVAQNLGYKSVFWSFAYVDWDPSNQPEISAAYSRVTGAAHKGAVYLLHGVSETNVAILPDVIDFLKSGVGIENGWN